MKINTQAGTPKTVEEKIEAAAAIIRREAELQGELAAIKRWTEKLQIRQAQIESELRKVVVDRLISLEILNVANFRNPQAARFEGFLWSLAPTF